MKQKPNTGAAAAEAAARRQERLAAALRENLKKRKEQGRGRLADEPGGKPRAVEPPGGDR
jgi:hypothetical protein